MTEILYSVASNLVGSLASLARDEFKFLMGVPKEIQRLQDRLERILPVLSNADTRRLQETAINRWVKQLRDIVYDADDIIQECKLQTKKSSLFSQLGLHHHKIGNKISDINQRLDDVLNDINFRNLIPSDRSGSSRVERGIVSRHTSPVVEPDLVGETMEEDVTTLVNMLVSSQKNQRRSRICVFAIVGMGGIGKTTLAQKIVNDDRIKTHFHGVKPIWKCVSQDYSEIDILRAIITGLGGDPGEDKKKEKLEPKLAEIVKDKRFFLVLDDVWDARVWEDLLSKPLQYCSEGTKVVVTTRHEDVARRIKATHLHQVRRLSDEDGWLLIRKSVPLDHEDVENLRDVGMKIVMKCDGLPLALRVIAGVLRDEKKTRRCWEGVLQNLSGSFPVLPVGVSNVLYLSYAELPSHLKQCFLYFALFPEDFEFVKEDLIFMWVAEGFVETRGDMLMEELATRYWDELVHRSLLQPDINHVDFNSCKMHDLLHSLARHLASDECSCLDMHELDKKSASSSRLARRLYISSSVESISDVITKHAPSRTLFIPSLNFFNKHDVARLKCLRVLNLRDSSIDNLPDSIGGLICLRYLNLSCTPIKKIPESIGKLASLQFLILVNCRDLRSLPNSVVNLCNLRCLDLFGTELHSMPVGIGRLRNLVTLLDFVVCSNKKGDIGAKKPEPCSLEELGSLSQLFTLSIKKLEDTTSSEAARAAGLKDKRHLIDLLLECASCSSDEKIEKIGGVFEELCPPPIIELLSINRYFGREFPRWMMNSPSLFLPNLRTLFLVEFALAERLPPLGLLPQLETLVIEGGSTVKIIGPEFFGVVNNACPRQPFPKLKVLEFDDMPNWEEWRWLREEEIDDQIHPLLPCLQRLRIITCPKLRTLPERLLRRATALTKLEICGADSLARIENLYHVEILELYKNLRLERISNLPALKELHIEFVRGGVGPGQLKITESFHSLRTVDLWDKRWEMESLPEWLEETRSLRKLGIYGASTELLSRCLQGGQEWHKIERINRFDAYDGYGDDGDYNYYIHYTRSPFSFDTNLNDEIDAADGDETGIEEVGGSSSNEPTD